jgi:hypothetical protein
MDINTLEEKLGIANLSDAEKLALVKGIESNVQASKAAVKAQEAGQYASLVVDAIKRIKNDLETRFNELNGIIDVKAKSLQDGKDGIDGKNGKDGRDGKDGKDGISITGPKGDNGADGVDGVGVQDAYIDFDGSLIIKLTDGKELNVGEVVPMDVAEKIKVIGNGGGTSQSVLDSLASLQAQIDSISGGSSGLTYKGTWNASTNTPTLASSTGTNGWYYVVSVAGSTNLNGVTDWQVGDWAIYNGSTWQKLDQTNLVTSVAGRTGAVTLSNTDISGLGTMSTQAASNVAITGGAIDGATVGATTPAAGTFTTLTANSTAQFGRSSANYVQAVGAASAAGPVVSSQGSDTNIDLNLTTKGAGSINFNTGNGIGFRVADSGTTSSAYWVAYGTNGGAIMRGTSASSVAIQAASAVPVQFMTNTNTEQMRVSHTASAVNYVQVTGSATLTGAPTISAQGSDFNIPLRLVPKGTGAVTLANSSGWSGLEVTTVNSPNYFTMAGRATGFGPTFSVAGVDTNIPLVLQPKGTGALQAQQTDSTATGGNARGANAVDWQMSRTAASQAATAQFSVIAGGYANTASAYASNITGGQFNTVQGNYNFIGGGASNTANSSFASSYSAIVSGQSNQSNGFYNFIGGGFTNAGTSASAVTTQSATMNGTTAVTLSGSNASIKVGQIITGTSIAGDTYVAAISGTSLTLSKVASGSSTSTLSFFTPHGVVVGGGNNQATGSYSFIGGGGDAGTAANRNVASGDWSTVGGGWANKATGQGSTVCGGGNIGGSVYGNTASATSSFVGAGVGNTSSGFASVIVGGFQNLANSQYGSILGGTYGTTRAISGYQVFPAHNNPITQAQGITQAAMVVLARQTTDATATVLCSDSGAASTTNQVILPNNSAYYFRGTVVAGVTGAGNTSSWSFEGTIKRGANAASTALVGTPVLNLIGQDSGASAWVVALTADTTNGGLAVTVTGQASTTIRWVAKIETTEMTY